MRNLKNNRADTVAVCVPRLQQTPRTLPASVGCLSCAHPGAVGSSYLSVRRSKGWQFGAGVEQTLGILAPPATSNLEVVPDSYVLTTARITSRSRLLWRSLVNTRPLPPLPLSTFWDALNPERECFSTCPPPGQAAPPGHLGAPPDVSFCWASH